MKKTFLHSTLGRSLIAIVALAAIAAGVHYAMTPASGASPVVMAKSPTPVVVQTLSERKMRLWTEFSGRIHAVDYAEIRPEVSGRITEVRFTDGQSVKAGDILFVIDPRPFEAAVARTEANLVSAQSRAALAKIDHDRYNSLIQSHAIAQSELDKVEDTQRVATASVAAAEADLKQARIDLEHAYVTAPISGRVSRAEITLGNLVQAGSSAPLLTSIVSQDGVYADFEVDEQTYMQSVRNLARNNAQESRIPVQLVVQGDTGNVYNGFIQSFDNRLDVTSGTIRARAKFENADGTLVPGMFVSVRLASVQEQPVILVPEQAISFDQSKKFVYVVDASNKISYREVELGRQVQAQRVVVSGLKIGDRVVVDGVQRVQPDEVVTATELATAPVMDTAKSGQIAKNSGPQ
jgi:multidrug efflux system membrane fusion protein